MLHTERDFGRGASVLIHPHKEATPTPNVRLTIQGSDEPAWALAERYGTSEWIIRKWRKRDDVQDWSRIPHRLQTTLTSVQEAVVRKFLNPNVSRSGLDACAGTAFRGGAI
jgi:hypothetical protein